MNYAFRRTCEEELKDNDSQTESNKYQKYNCRSQLNKHGAYNTEDG